ncbi:MAG: type IV pilin-like G/H family protein [Pseudanabaena sp. ELA607]|jgi:type IV pilus assembly protein PilA
MKLLSLALQMLGQKNDAKGYANNSSTSDQSAMAGFTLIELLVVIIIIGILAAISLPSFLSQANKARMAEAKSYIGSMNRTQHGYYLQFSQFASNVDSLGVGLSQGTTHYNYSIVSSGSYPIWKLATNFGQAKSGSLKSYAGVVAMIVTNQVYEVQVRSVMCISGQPVAAPVSGDYDAASNFPTCPSQFLLDESQ